jgi:hypothetical protein
MAQHEFVGVLFDCISESLVDRSPVIRATYAEAMADARAMVAPVNQMAEERDDAADDNSTIGRVDESYCFVMVDGEVDYAGWPA